MSDEALIKNIKNEIEKCGFPLEIYVIEECSKKNTGRIPNYRYLFKDKLREIDLDAHFSDIIFNKKNNPQFTVTQLIIECKKSDKPWVFFSSKMHEQTDVLSFLQYQSTFNLEIPWDSKSQLLRTIESSLKSHHYSLTSIPKCVSYFEPFRTDHAESNIYVAIDSVLNFLDYSMARWRKIYTNKLQCATYFYYPIIVLQGKLFEAQIREGKTDILSRNHIQIRGIRDHGVFIVDIVTKEYFPTFFEMLDVDHKACVSAISKIKREKNFKTEAIEFHKSRYLKSKS